MSNVDFCTFELCFSPRSILIQLKANLSYFERISSEIEYFHLFVDFFFLISYQYLLITIKTAWCCFYVRST